MTNRYPVLPLRDIVVFPNMIVPLFVGRDKSVAALEAAMSADKEIFLIAQLDPAEDDPGRDDLYDVGVSATVAPVEELAAEGKQVAALMRSVVDQFENYAKLNRKLPAETAVQLSEIDDASRLADAVAGNISIKVSDKQALLVERDPAKRLEMAFAFMEGELG